MCFPPAVHQCLIYRVTETIGTHVYAIPLPKQSLQNVQMAMIIRAKPDRLAS